MNEPNSCLRRDTAVCDICFDLVLQGLSCHLWNLLSIIFSYLGSRNIRYPFAPSIIGRYSMMSLSISSFTASALSASRMYLQGSYPSEKSPWIVHVKSKICFHSDTFVARSGDSRAFSKFHLICERIVCKVPGEILDRLPR